MITHEERFPNWKKIYEEQPVETMPWFNPNLDEDVLNELKKRKISSGDFLDIGTGPATQALKLEGMGFKVTGTDISTAAIVRAKTLSKTIKFLEDDILDTQLKGPFDCALDRGCFHVLPVEKRSIYVTTLHRLLKSKGLLFLKTFSILEKEDGLGPYRFTPQAIEEIFKGKFTCLSSVESGFIGTRDVGRKALFSVLQRKV